MRNFLFNKKGASFIAAIVMLISVMMAAVIGAIVFFAFADSGADQVTVTHDVIDPETDEFIQFVTIPGATPNYNITKVNNTAVTSYIETGYAYVSANRTLQINESQFHDENDTSASLTITYNGRAGDVTSSVVIYAITVFALLAIIPLIMVGGLMLRSLGFMSGGENF